MNVLRGSVRRCRIAFWPNHGPICLPSLPIFMDFQTMVRNPLPEGVANLVSLLHPTSFLVIEIHASDQVDGAEGKSSGWHDGTRAQCEVVSIGARREVPRNYHNMKPSTDGVKGHRKKQTAGRGIVVSHPCHRKMTSYLTTLLNSKGAVIVNLLGSVKNAEMYVFQVAERSNQECKCTEPALRVRPREYYPSYAWL